jgi:hypothetical protein
MKAPHASSVIEVELASTCSMYHVLQFAMVCSLANIICIAFGSKLVFNHGEVYQNSETLSSF